MDRQKVSSGVGDLDRLLGGLYIGDNIIWYDEVGGLVNPFVANFVENSLEQNRPVIYITFDRSPKNILNRFGSLMENPRVVIVDCFTNGKGNKADIFQNFYGEKKEFQYNIFKVENPFDPDSLLAAISRFHADIRVDTRFVFETLTGMQDLWGGEEALLKFYAHTCPRLYELNTIAYWIVNKAAHSEKLKARLNHITQVAIELFLSRDKMFLTVLKAEDRPVEMLNKATYFSIEENNITFYDSRYNAGRVDMGRKLIEIRKKRGISQKELARMIGVTPSTISQLESNRIYPSIPALLKMSEILGVDVGYFFGKKSEDHDAAVFSDSTKLKLHISEFPEDSIGVYFLMPLDVNPKAEPYLVEIPQGKVLNAHFFIHKGEEIGYVLKGKLQMTLKGSIKTASKGDVIFLSSEIPSQWKNIGQGTAQMLWFKVK